MTDMTKQTEAISTERALKLALEAQIHKAGMNPVMQGECYLMHPEALQKLIEVAIREARASEAKEQPAPATELREQEPVAWCVLEPWLSGKFEAQDCFSDVALDANVGWVPLYTTPPAAQPAPVQESEKRECMNCAAFGECNPNNDAGRCGYEPPAAQRQWVGLTDEDIEQEFGFIDELLRDCVHRTEAKVVEKNRD